MRAAILCVGLGKERSEIVEPDCSRDVDCRNIPITLKTPSISATPDFVNYAAPTLPGVVTLVVSATPSTHGVLSPPTVGNVGFLSRGTSRG